MFCEFNLKSESKIYIIFNSRLSFNEILFYSHQKTYKQTGIRTVLECMCLWCYDSLYNNNMFMFRHKS